MEEQLAKRLGRAPRSSGGAEPSGRAHTGGDEGSDDDSDDDPLLQGIGVQVRACARPCAHCVLACAASMQAQHLD